MDPFDLVAASGAILILAAAAYLMSMKDKLSVEKDKTGMRENFPKRLNSYAHGHIHNLLSYRTHLQANPVRSICFWPHLFSRRFMKQVRQVTTLKSLEAGSANVA